MRKVKHVRNACVVLLALSILLYPWLWPAFQYKDSTSHIDDGPLQNLLGFARRTLQKPTIKKPHRILCWLLTETKHLDTRARAVKETWGKRCDKTLYFSSTENATFPTIGLDIPEGRAYLTSKMVVSCSYNFKLYGNEFDWFFKADDDTYVIMENLRKLLETKDPTQAVYLGYRFKPYTPQGYMSGGAGYVLSREALRKLVQEGMIARKCQTFFGMEDLDIGRCLYEVGVKVSDSIDLQGLERFHPLSLDNYFHSYLLPNWTHKYAYHPLRRGYKCCSNSSVTFHYVRPATMYIMDYLIYHLKH